MAQGKVFIANTTFACELDGTAIIVHKGATRVREGHPLLDTYRDSFDPLELKIEYDIEEATAPPMRPVRESKTAAK